MRSKLRWLLACLLVVGVLTCPALATSSFPDVADDAAYGEAVEYLNDVGIMQGDTQGNFNPDKAVSRAEMATILCRMLGETEDLEKNDTLFSDVPASHWANSYIAKASELGIINGYGNGKFGPNDTVTYEQAITMVIQATGGASEAQEMGGILTDLLPWRLILGC